MREVAYKALWFMTACSSTTAYAEEKIVIGSKSVEPFSTANLSEWTIGLFAVLVVIGIVAWIAKRFSGFGVNQVGHMNVVSGISVGHREKVLLIRAGEQHLLLGVAPGRVQTLHTFEKGEITDIAASQTSNFQETMRNALSKKAEQ
jgi:flagellar protein FliO/FliZ